MLRYSAAKGLSLKRGEGKWLGRLVLSQEEAHYAMAQAAGTVKENGLSLGARTWDPRWIEREEVQDEHSCGEIRKVHQKHEAKMHTHHGQPQEGSQLSG